MTNDASRAVREADRQTEEDLQAGEARPSLADWLVTPLRQSRPPASVKIEDAPPTVAPSSVEEPALAAEVTESGAPLLGLAPLAVAADGVDELGERVAPETLSPQIFSNDEGPEPEEDEDEFAVVPFTTGLPGGHRVVRGVVALTVIAILLIAGRWVVRGSSPAAKIERAPVVLAARPPLPAVRTEEPASVAVAETPEEAATSPEPPGRATKRTGSVARSVRPSPPDTTSPEPLVAPAWSVARFPDLPRDVLIACEQAAAQASGTSGAPAEPAMNAPLDPAP